MTVATFNIEGFVRPLPQLRDWRAATKPNVACLQVLEATSAQFAQAVIEAAG